MDSVDENETAEMLIEMLTCTDGGILGGKEVEALIKSVKESDVITREHILHLKFKARNLNPKGFYIYYGYKDDMNKSHLHLAVVFKALFEDSVVLCGEQVYVYVDKMWKQANTRVLKGVFIRIVGEYMGCLIKIRNDDKAEKGEDSEELRCFKYTKWIQSDTVCISILSLFKSLLKESDIVFDTDSKYYNDIQFKNGVYNLETNSFRKRNVADYITKTLDFDYTDTYEKAKYQEIDSFFTKLQPQLEQRNFTTSFLKYCLKGGNPITMFKMNIGYSAANGKSTELAIMHKVFGMYVAKLDKTTFAKNNTKRHKHLAKVLIEPIRLAYIEELDQDKLDVDVIKEFVDCKQLELEQLFGTMMEKKKHQCKLMTTSNKDPNMEMDKGVIRRITIQHYTSQFVEKNIDDSKHRYALIREYENQFEDVEYKLAFFHYLLNAPKLIVPESNRELAKETLEENDEFLTLFNEHFAHSQSVDDKVSKSDVMVVFASGKWSQLQQLNKELKRLGVIYDKTGTLKGEKKIYRNIVKLNCQDEEVG